MNTPTSLTESLEERVHRLARELERAIKLDRPSILLAVYQSRYVAEEAQQMLAAQLYYLEQTIEDYQITGESNADAPAYLAQQPDRHTTVYFIMGLSAGGGPDGLNAYRALNIRREYFIEHRLRVVVWLTEQEATALPTYAPDFWAFRHRVVEFPDAPIPAAAAERVAARVWEDFSDRTLREDTEAKIALRKALLADLPDSAETQAARVDLLYTLGGLHWATGDFDKAIDYFRQAQVVAADIHDIGKQSWIHNGLGNVYRTLDRTDEAIAAYQRAIELDPKFAYPHNGLGAVYQTLGRTDEAIAAFQRAIELDPKFAYPHNGLGNAYRDLGRTDEALAAYQRAIELDPKFAYPHNGLGNVYDDLGRTAEAIAAYQRAIELGPKDAYPHNGLGYMYQELGRTDDAIAAYQRAIELDPKLAVPRFSLIACLRKLGREAEAAEHLTIARELIGKETEYNRACFEAVCGSVDEALALLKVALEKKQVSLAWARRDPDFEALRSDPRFLALVGAADNRMETRAP